MNKFERLLHNSEKRKERYQCLFVSFNFILTFTPFDSISIEVHLHYAGR